MNRVFIMLASELATTSCCFIAGYLAYYDKPGWGWFLFIAVLVASSVSFKDKKEEK